MTKDEFMNNLKGSDQGFNMDKDYLGRIYDNIKASPIELAGDDRQDLTSPELTLSYPYPIQQP